ncbi:MAG: hypothetical protein IKD04_07900 [Clostridia bacterium]|nr:hypothetical protein [Clostridia bacterium]
MNITDQSNTCINNSNWIWLPEREYPDLQKCDYNILDLEKKYPRLDTYGAAEFIRDYNFEKKVAKAEIKVCGDTYYRLFLNGEYLTTGPVAAGGDFLCLKQPRYYYYQPLTVFPESNKISFYALVLLGPVMQTEYSFGRGGFCLWAKLTFEDGTCEEIITDGLWKCRSADRYITPASYDQAVKENDFINAEIVESVWNLKQSFIPVMDEEVIIPNESSAITVPVGETVIKEIEFDKIYSAYIGLNISGKANIKAYYYEIPQLFSQTDCEKIHTEGALEYKSLHYHSVGFLKLEITNEDTNPIDVSPYLIFTHYPIGAEGEFVSSDGDLNKVYDVCKWTLKICRQTLHLDSPKHQEPLACAGDYAIETLMDSTCFDDMRLSEFDVMRIADNLVINNGRIFHTGYSMLWIQMLWDTYMFTANRDLLEYCADALNLLLNRFDSYLGSNGLLEKAPDYMFLDWNVVEGYTLHHPPKFLGQTALCMFYLGGLGYAAKVFNELNRTEHCKACLEKAENLKAAIEKNLYDKEVGLFFDGLPTDNCLPSNTWLPDNENKRHFSKHSNILAVLYGAVNGDNAKRILDRVIEDNTLPDIQPYFMHYMFGALTKENLMEPYFMQLLNRWKEIVAKCDKGLQEGWFAPDDNGDYPFDYSHAWGGTPAYYIPKTLLGLEVLEAGYKKIKILPKLYGLEWAKISIPTPFGMISCYLEKGKEPQLNVPEGIKVV